MGMKKFTSSFADVMNDYLERKMAAGYKKRSFSSPLSLFDEFLNGKGKKDVTLTKEEGLEWIARRSAEKPRTWYSRVHIVNSFLVDAANRGYDIVPTGNVKIAHNAFKPHIYSEDERRRYFEEVDRYEVRHRPHFSLVLPVLFRVLLGCGTRIEETLSIKVKDVDLGSGLITLHETKNGKERIVVMHESLKRIFLVYADKCFYTKGPDSYVFAKADGAKLSSSWIHSIHIEILRRARIPFHGGGDGPRIHDWRHTFAVLSVRRMTDLGMDMYAALPILSAYLGHKGINATEHYVRLTLDRFPYIQEKLSCSIEGIFSEEECHETY